MRVAECPIYFEPPPGDVLAAFEENDGWSPLPFSDADKPVPDAGEPDRWWRQFPNTVSEEHMYPIGDAISKPPLETLQVVIGHLAMLETLGIANPIIKFHLVNHEDSVSARLYTLCHHVEGLDDIDLWRPENIDKLTEWSNIMEKYAEWLRVSNQPYMLHDTSNLRQYIWGATPQNNKCVPYFFDTDPIVSVSSAESIEIYLDKLDMWRRPVDRRRNHEI